jgi:hypothetical protein
MWFGAAFGVVGVAFTAVIAVWITMNDRPPPRDAVVLFRVIIALAAAGVGVVLPGFLDVAFDAHGLAIRAACGFALFVIVYFFDPPGRVDRGHGRDIPRPGPVVKRKRPGNEGP